MLYFVRHAKAGSRSSWTGDDRLRPLTKNGEAQAKAIAEELADEATGLLLSSPWMRCMQTLEPLAQLIGTKVVPEPRLGEEQSVEGALEFVYALPEGSVMCGHGDLLPAAIDALQRRGCHIEGEPDFRKGCTWVLERVDGMFVRAFVRPPPSV